MIKQMIRIPKIHSSGTRDAVETAIDLSRGIKKTTWDTLAKKYSKLIPYWDSLESAVEITSQPDNKSPLPGECKAK